ncbi:hypothetical protein PENTCL1PPCAC_28319, partial [Pristionchus entomophagus]
MALNGLHTFLFSYVCVAHVLYLVLVISILRQRKTSSIMKGSFFSLVIGHYVADVIYLFEFNILMRGRKYGYLTSFFQPGSPALIIVPRISTALHYYIKIVVYIGQIVFALNRLTSAMFPINYNHIWTFKLLVVIWFFQWTVPLAAVLPINLDMNFTIKYEIYSSEGTLRLENDPVSTDIIAYIDMATSVTGTFFSFIMYILTCVVVRRDMAAQVNLELRLLTSAIIVFIVLSVNTVMQVLTILQNKVGLSGVMFINDLSYPVNDMIFTVQPWALLIFSSVIRSHIWATLRGKKYE